MKTKYYKILIAGLSFLFLGSCNDVLDKELLTSISDQDIWNDKNLIQAYVNDLYSRAPYTGVFTDWYRYSDEATAADGNQNALNQGNMSKTNDQLGYWDYSLVRAYNLFLEKVNSLPVTVDLKTKWEGEVRLMRAVYYFEMAKRYGGVPVVEKVLDPNAPVEENMLPRNTEVEVFKFIETEIDKSIKLLENGNSPKENFNYLTAYAYKARTMLWAASIAKYSTVQLDGIVGMPASQSDYYYKVALDAAEKVINSNKYSLYNKYDDKIKNYQGIFTEKDNSEIILQRAFNGNELGHSFDNNNTPPSYRLTYGGRCNPVWEMILSYENTDGTADQPLLGKENLYDNAYALLKKKDARLHASIMYQGANWQGSSVDIYEAIDPNANPNPSNLLSNIGESYNGKLQVGKDFTGSSEAITKSGFYIRKYMDETLIKPGENKSSTSWIEIRLGEMYLIAAESAFELGDKAKALARLNAIRQRAGIMLLTETSITIEKIRNERKIELAFENFRYWDLRRWRISESNQVNNGVRFHGLKAVFHYPSGKYYFLLKDAETFVRTFRPEHYYNPITTARINNNTSLIENPNY